MSSRIVRAVAIAAVALWGPRFAAVADAQPPGGFDPSEMVRRLDDNDNGQVDPDEMEGRARGFLESIARDNNLDLSKPVPNDKLRDLLRARFQGEPGGPGSSYRGSPSSSSSPRSATPAPAVKAFGVSTSGAAPTVLGFGADAGADSWDALRSKYDGRVVERVEDSLRRYDRNQDGALDAEELKENRWDSGHPLDFDKNRDGKVQRGEMAERYKQRYSSGYYDRGSYGGGPPGGFSGGPPGMVVMRSSSSPPPSQSTPSGPSSTSANPPRPSSTSSSPPNNGSSSNSSNSSASAGASGSGGDDRMARYAEGLLKQYDANKDGILQRDEWSKMRSESQKADRDGNGLITKEELAAQLADYSKGRSGGSSNSSGGSSSSNSGGSASYASRSYGSGSSSSSAPRSSGTVKTYRFLSPAERLPSGLPDWFTRNDADGDGQIAMAEFSSSWDDQKAAEFTRWDRNGDGIITPKEALGSGQ